MYRGGRPNPLAGVVSRATSIVASAGLSPKRLVTLEVEGRRSGRLISFPVVIADYEGSPSRLGGSGPTRRRAS